jgi:23S rRNA (uracil1939-C5)-methyltransferase
MSTATGWQCIRVTDAPEAALASPKLRRGDELELEVSDLAHGGRGVARRNGYVVFVAGGLPGDRVRARVDRRRRDFAEATALELLTPSPDRVADRCLHDGEPCPGAPWQGLPYERQLAEKERLLAEALRRLGGLDGFALEPIVPAVEAWRYRNKLEYSFGRRGAELVLGFHRRGSWSEVVDAGGCLLASERADEARAQLASWAASHRLEPYDRRRRVGTLRNLVVREGRRTGRLQTRLVTSETEIPRPPVDLHTIVEGPGGGTAGPTGALGAERLVERVGGVEVEVSATAFLQTNTGTADRLYATVAEFAALARDERVFDLYCGVGTIGLALARSAGEVWGIEAVPEAVVDAELNAELNGIANARFRAADARLGLRPLVAEAGRPDLVVVDPPRAGLGKKVVRRVLEAAPRRIVYVSCNPTTLAPNAAQLTEGGYRLRRVRPVDMFPQTPHIECVALFEQAAGSR